MRNLDGRATRSAIRLRKSVTKKLVPWARPNKYVSHKPSSEKNSAGQRRVARGLRGDA